ncbi:MAG: hypothetical protein ACRCWQ_02775 [Bacilli bacterium]
MIVSIGGYEVQYSDKGAFGPQGQKGPDMSDNRKHLIVPDECAKNMMASLHGRYDPTFPREISKLLIDATQLYRFRDVDSDYSYTPLSPCMVHFSYTERRAELLLDVLLNCPRVCNIKVKDIVVYRYSVFKLNTRSSEKSSLTSEHYADLAYSCDLNNYNECPCVVYYSFEYEGETFQIGIGFASNMDEPLRSAFSLAQVREHKTGTNVSGILPSDLADFIQECRGRVSNENN